MISFIPLLTLFLTLTTSVLSKVAKSDSHHHDLTEMHHLFNFGSKEVFTMILKNNTNVYNKRSPFPYAVIDGIFPDHLLSALSHEIPDSPRLRADGCVDGSIYCALDKQHEYLHNSLDESTFGPATNAAFAFLRSSRFIYFLQTLTGIDNLIADPHFNASGVHQTLSGGFMKIHSDANHNQRFNFHRRVNVYLYINPDWKDEYGGHLELWDNSLKTCNAMIRPSFGRLVIFTTTDFNYHGHQQPLQTPAQRSRRALAMYYYTSGRPSTECIAGNCHNSHETHWQTPACASCQDSACKKFQAIV